MVTTSQAVASQMSKNLRGLQTDHPVWWSAAEVHVLQPSNQTASYREVCKVSCISGRQVLPIELTAHELCRAWCRGNDGVFLPRFQ
jgi:hypothetical protein